MENTAKYLLENIPGAQCAYHQSDEISILVTNYQLSNREPWFDNNINKIVSITAAMATLTFNRNFSDRINKVVHPDECLGARKKIIREWSSF